MTDLLGATLRAPAPEPSADPFERLARAVDEAAAGVEALDAPAREKAHALRQAIEAFHAHALRQLIRGLREQPEARARLAELVQDPAVFALCSMHGLLRPDLRARVARVLDLVRPYMQSHGGDVELVEVDGDRVVVRLHGACRGCSMSAETLRGTVEEALREHVPEVRTIEVAPAEPGPALVTLESRVAHDGWLEGPLVEDVQAGRPVALDAGEHKVLIVRLGDALHAYRNACAHLGLPLDRGMVDLAAGTITCPWHGWRYDAATGECLTAPQAQLEPFPLRVQEGRVWVRPR
ncbi:MAG: NifU family protein [Gemmatimonadales bacterium]|nr:NifU family protein [Gemmatimonadales bacterium]